MNTKLFTHVPVPLNGGTVQGSAPPKRNPEVKDAAAVRRWGFTIICSLLLLPLSVCAGTAQEGNAALGSIDPYPALPYKELITTPGEFRMCHAPSLAELPDGGLFVVWYAEKQGSTDTDLYGARRAAHTRAWSEPFLIHDGSPASIKNPTLYVGRDNRLILFWTLQRGGSKWNRRDLLQYKVSNDLGHTWGEARDLGAPERFITRTRPIRLRNGWVLLPIYADWCNLSAVMISKDDGMTWGSPRWILPFLGIQPAVVQRADGTLFTLMRTGMWPRRSWQAVSADNGVHWWGQWVSGVQNPNSSLEMASLKNGHIVLTFNDSRKDRYSLSIAVSCDGGRTWPWVKMIECKPDHLFSYPSVIQDRQGLIHAVYSHDNQTGIAHFVTNEEWIGAFRPRGT